MSGGSRLFTLNKRFQNGLREYQLTAPKNGISYEIWSIKSETAFFEGITVDFKEILILPGEADDKGELSNDMNESFRS